MPKPLDRIPGEVWASIPRHPTYWVSSLGRVRSPRGVLKPRPRDRGGHLSVVFPDRSDVLVHRLVAQAFIPNPDALPKVLHGDDDPTNNRWDNLRWGTQLQNMADRKARGGYSKKVAA